MDNKVELQGIEWLEIAHIIWTISQMLAIAEVTEYREEMMSCALDKFELLVPYEIALREKPELLFMVEKNQRAFERIEASYGNK